MDILLLPHTILDVIKALCLMQSLPLVESQKVENAYLPHHSSLEVCFDSGEVVYQIPGHL